MGWLRVGAAAELAGMSKRTLRYWIVDGRVPDSALLQTGRREYRVAAWWCQAQRPPAPAVPAGGCDGSRS
jgi:hypothetical protein